MGIVANYLDYRQHKPKYADWKDERNESEAKRIAYVNNVGIDEAQKQSDIKRAQVVLNAVDIMDEYSQTNAENTETAIIPVRQTLLSAASYGGAAIGILLYAIRPVRNFLGDITKTFGVSKEAGLTVALGALGSIFTLAITPLIHIWSTKKEIEASRIGRHEAMNKDLASVNHFAVLTDEQIAQRDEAAKSVKITKKEAEKATQARTNIFKALKNILLKNKDYEASKVEFEKRETEHKANFDKVQLSDEQIEEAKKDQQLISNVVEKIDIASQDYAENVELAMGVVGLFVTGSSGLTGFLTNKVLKSPVFKNIRHKELISVGVGLLTSIAMSMQTLKLQKQASRIGRFKAKQDFMNNPEKLFYVDDTKAQSQDGTQYKEENKKVNIFKFIPQAFKDAKEYEDYLKNENIEIQQKRKAQEQIELTPEQEARARQLQQNVFRVFNKVDDKSQAYSESAETLGEFASNAVNSLAAIIPTIVALLPLKNVYKGLQNKPLQQGENFSPSKILEMFPKGSMKRTVLTTIISFATAIGFNMYITREQKNASRVADMLALDELNDYRNFADYSTDSAVAFKSKDEATISATPSQVQQEITGSKYLK